MAASESSEGPPDNATSPPGTSGTIVTSELQTTLSNLNDNMTSMAHILELIYKERCPPGNDNMKRAAPTGDSNSPLPHERPPKRARVESAEEYSADEDDSLSVTTSDNLCSYQCYARGGGPRDEVGTLNVIVHPTWGILANFEHKCWPRDREV